MASHATPFFITFVRDLPPRSEVVGGEQIRPLELLDVLAEHGTAGEVWCVAPTALRTVGSIRVRRLPLPRWAPAREALAVPASLAVFLIRVCARRRRVVLYQRIAGGVAIRGRMPFVSEPGWLFFGLARLLKVSTWASMHDLSPEHEMQSLQRAGVAGIDLSEADQRRTRRLARVNGRIQRWALPRATVVTVVSESIRRRVTERYGIADERIITVRAGFNPTMLAPVEAWAPPIERPWTVAYVGSRFDLQLGLLLAATRKYGDEVELLLAGRGMNEVSSARERRCKVADARYEEFAQLANQVDIWVVPIADDPYLNWGWHLKLPMNLATGRPVVLCRTEELALSGLSDLFFVAEPSASGIEQQLDAILCDPQHAQDKALLAQNKARETMTWAQSLRPVLERLSLVRVPNRDLTN